MEPLYTITGVVKAGQNRGKKLGFPTANIQLENKIPEGIYASQVEYQGKKYLAATFIGSAKTFSENDFQLETYLLDFSENLYNQTITVHLYQKLRDNQKFSSAEDLVKQIEIDVLRTREFFNHLR